MADHSQILLPLLFCFYLVSLCFAGNLSFTFPPQANIAVQGNATARETIQLTKYYLESGMNSSAGAATYIKTIPLWDKYSGVLANLTTRFRFIIRVARYTEYTGDGLTFFMAPPDFKQPPNASNQWLGLFNETNSGNSLNNYRIVAVEFDTYKNSFDPDDNHVGIDVNGIQSVVNISLSDRLAKENLKKGKSWDAWVDYNGKAQKLEVFLAYNPYKSNLFKPASPILSYGIDLRNFLPQDIIVGFSSSTFLSNESHTIESWSFSCEYSWGSDGKKSSNVKAVLIPVLGSVLVLSALVFFGIWWYRNKRNGDTSDETDLELDECFTQGPRRFSYAELVAATRNFSEDKQLGQGGFGGVYRGVLAGTNETLAVKRISQGSKQGKKEYVSEVTIISKLRHRNLVQLLGWCHKKGELLLVYEFLPNGSLDKHLFAEHNGTTHLSWEQRYSIACDVASALVYLHEEWDQRVVHRDIKASNVMLDSNFNAKLGDFGLARVVERDHRASYTTVVAGTFGYLAPECVITGKASLESDVFSFGAVALEIACGKRPVDRTLTEHNCRLVEWVWDLYGQGKILEAADEKLDGDFKAEEMERLMAVGLLCSHPDPKARPAIREVLKFLKFEAELPYVPLKLPVAVYSDPLRPDGSSSGTSMTLNSSAASFSSSEPSKASIASRPL